MQIIINIANEDDKDLILEALEEHKPDILGMSALLTTTMPEMKRVIEALEQEGLRNAVKVMVGGAPVDAAFADGVVDQLPVVAGKHLAAQDQRQRWFALGQVVTDILSQRFRVRRVI